MNPRPPPMKQMSTAITPAPVPSPRRRPSATTSRPMTTIRTAAGNRQRETRGETERHQRRRVKVGQKRVEQRRPAEQRVDRRDVAPRREARRGGEVLRPVRPHRRVSRLEPARIRVDGVREDRDDHRGTAQANATIENHGMRCAQRSRDSTHDACHVARGLTVSSDTASGAAERERRSGEHGRGVEPGEQREPVGCGGADEEPAGHADRSALSKGEVRPHKSGQAPHRPRASARRRE